MPVNMIQADESNDIVSAIHALQLCVFYLIHLRVLVHHSLRPSRFKCTQMKIIHKHIVFPNFDFICFPQIRSNI